ncbi:MAG: TonB-dependent receptor, partial [Acidobacteriota bacterium]|nr:TonB-dependent receptor [Acidobacteriota bacterium]
TEDFVKTLTNDRQMQMVMAMTPGAVEDNNPSMLGGASTDNVYLIDGADHTDPTTKTWSTAMNFDTLKEIQVVTGGVSAEHGRFQGSVVNLVTKSGGNEFHGNIRFVKSDFDWNEEAEGKPFDEATKYTQEDRFATTLGGPIIKDKLWFFTSYETRGKNKNTFYYEDWQSHNEGDASQEAAIFPKYEGHYFNLKLTYQMNDSHSFVAQFIEDPIEFPNSGYRNYSNYRNPLNSGVQEQGGENFNFDYNWVVNANSFLKVSFNRKDSPLNQLAGENLQSSHDNPVLQLVTNSGSYYDDLNFAYPNSYVSAREYDAYKASYDTFLNSAWGTHNIKVGTEFRESTNGSKSDAWNGGARLYVRLDFPDASSSVRFYDYRDTRDFAFTYEDYTAFYINDSWTVNDKLTVTLGLRTEDISLSNLENREIISADYGSMISPRMGFAYDLDGASINGSASRYYDAPNDYLVDNSQPDLTYERDYYRLIYTVNQLREMGIEPWDNPADYEQIHFANHPELWTYQYTSTFGSVGQADIMEWNPAYMDEFTLGYERQVGRAYAFGIRGVHRSWQDAIEDVDPDQDETYEYITYPGEWREYNAVMLTAQKRLANDGLQFTASYTYSETKGVSSNDSGSTSLFDSPYQSNPDFYYGRVNDRPHQVKFFGSYTFDFGTRIGLNYQYYSGAAWTPTIAVENVIEGTNRTGDLETIWAAPRGSERYPSWSRADMHIEHEFTIRRFKLSVYADIFNVVNSRDPISVSTYMGRGGFNTNAEPGTQEYLDFILNNYPVLDGEVRSAFNQPTEYTFPRSYYLGMNFVF